LKKSIRRGSITSLKKRKDGGSCPIPFTKITGKTDLGTMLQERGLEAYAKRKGFKGGGWISFEDTLEC